MLTNDMHIRVNYSDLADPYFTPLNSPSSQPPSGASGRSTATWFSSPLNEPAPHKRGPLSHLILDPAFKPHLMNGATLGHELAHQRRVRNLTLFGDLSVANLSPLRHKRELRWLDLRHVNGLEEQHFKVVASLPNLTELNLAGHPDVTDAGLRHLETAPNLLRLDLMGCTRVSASALSRFIDRGACMPASEPGSDKRATFSCHAGELASHVEQYPSARTVKLCGEIGGEHVEMMDDLTDIQELDLRGCTNRRGAGLDVSAEILIRSHYLKVYR